jgi:hypothetical protein
LGATTKQGLAFDRIFLARGLSLQSVEHNAPAAFLGSVASASTTIFRGQPGSTSDNFARYTTATMNKHVYNERSPD